MRPCRACKGSGFIEDENLSSPSTTPEKDIKDAILISDIPGDSKAPLTSLANQQDNKKSLPITKPAAKKPEEELGQMMGYTPFMVEAILAEPKMNATKWREKYQSVLSDPLAVIVDTTKQLLPDSRQRAQFRENLARQRKAAPRKINIMKTQDIAGNLEGLE